MGFSSLPLYTQFHVAIGITAIVFAGLALFMRVPLSWSLDARLKLHPVMGNLYVFFAGMAFVDEEKCAVFFPYSPPPPPQSRSA